MQTAAEMNIDVAFHMDGRNKNIIHWTTKCMLVDKVSLVLSLIAHIIILIMSIDDMLSVNSFDYFPVIEGVEVIDPSINSINLFSQSSI
jgi:hypothetical protein